MGIGLLLSDDGHKLSFENLLTVYVAFQQALKIVSFTEKLILPILLALLSFSICIPICVCFSFIMQNLILNIQVPKDIPLLEKKKKKKPVQHQTLENLLRKSMYGDVLKALKGENPPSPLVISTHPALQSVVGYVKYSAQFTHYPPEIERKTDR